MDRRFLGILGALIIIFIGIFVTTQHSGNSSSSGKSNGAGATNHVEGQNAKGITLQEWGDYECPICAEYYQPLKQAAAQYSSDIHFQFSNLPLTQIHQNAFAAARAAEAAGAQNKFWEMHNKLYENQNEWASSSSPLTSFSDYAKQIGLNVDQFKQDYASSKVNDSINADIAAFDKTGKDHATPTFFLDGVYVPNTDFADPQTGQPNATKIGDIIKAAIAKKSQQSSSSSSSASQSQASTSASSAKPY